MRNIVTYLHCSRSRCSRRPVLDRFRHRDSVVCSCVGPRVTRRRHRSPTEWCTRLHPAAGRHAVSYRNNCRTARCGCSRWIEAETSPTGQWVPTYCASMMMVDHPRTHSCRYESRRMYRRNLTLTTSTPIKTDWNSVSVSVSAPKTPIWIVSIDKFRFRPNIDIWHSAKIRFRPKKFRGFGIVPKVHTAGNAIHG